MTGLLIAAVLAMPFGLPAGIIAYGLWGNR
jgi:hypothetical protein